MTTMWRHGPGMALWMWLVFGLGTVGFWVVIALIVRAILPGWERPDPGPTQPDPLTLLKERLARGEISPEEFEQRRRLIVDGH